MKVYEVRRSDRFALSSTSKGNQIKWKIGSVWLKADSFGYESISEALFSTFEKYVSGISFVDYSLCIIREVDESSYTDYFGCSSKDFLKDDCELISVYKILNSFIESRKVLASLSGVDLFRYVVKRCSEVTGIDEFRVGKYFSDIIKLDSIILNEDRHLNNICFIRNENRDFIFAPIFDNGLSLLSDLIDYSLSKPDIVCINSIKSKPFSSSFSKQLKYVSDFNPLNIDYNGFLCELENCYVDFKIEEFERAKRVLLYMLKKRKGVAWNEVLI